MTQGQLIRAARGTMSQSQFAQVLKVDRSCLSRYESEQLGAPTAVLNHCLRVVATQLAGDGAPESPVERSLRLAREVVAELETLSRPSAGGGRRR
jgi:ribosome-binding protein aMBF1 (putative translation factor)